MRTALLSTSDKTNLVDLATRLYASGWRLVASGGTAQAVTTAGLPVIPVSEITGEPEMLGGRVKTLHPAIHAGLLARDTDQDRSALDDRGWHPIDLVVVNLYPFEKASSRPGILLEDAVEQIDIGGVALMRAAAKNFDRVTVLSDPSDYPADLSEIDRPDFRQRMALKAFAHTSHYDSVIQAKLARLLGKRPPAHLALYRAQELRYGENPHQEAAFLGSHPGASPMGGRQLQGKALSFNNLIDLDAAWSAALAFSDPTVVVVKHAGPCGIASAPAAKRALRPAIQSDPVSAFGSVIACNREVDRTFVEELGELFVEALIAPSFSQNAQSLLAERVNLRLVQAPAARDDGLELRSIIGGYLQQTTDWGDPADSPEWQAVSQREPTVEEMSSLRFAWKACRFVKSNAIVLANSDGDNHYTVGIGGGQPNRLDSVRIAGERAGDRAPRAVLASDAFFPFPDGVETAAILGVTAIVQPGGSLRDELAIAAADAAGMAMVFTGVRHFRH